jgi:hypothetical protein
MSRTKDLKTNPEFNINLFELFSLFSPNKKTKYTETLLRVMKKTPNLDEHCEEIKDFLMKEFKIPLTDIENIPNLHLVFFHRLIDGMFNSSDLKTFQKFCEYNERGLIKQNDVSTYQCFDEINNAVSMAEIVVESKDLEKQVKLVHEDDEWLFVRPLTFNASKKYGANTKWCTTTESNPEYFTKYASKGVLIYCLNKKTGYKVASFRSLDKSDPEFSWWNQKDTRIDSLQSEVPDELLKVIRVESMEKAKTNRFLLSDTERAQEDKFLSKYGSYKIMQPIDLLEPQAEERIRRISRGIERNAIERLNDLDEIEVETQEMHPMAIRRLVEAYQDEPTIPEVDISAMMDMTEPTPEQESQVMAYENRRSGSFDFRGER